MGLCSPSFPPKLKIQHSLWKPDEWDQKISHLCSSSVRHYQTWSVDNLRFCCQFRKKHFGRQYLWKPAGAKGWRPDPEIIFPENLLLQSRFTCHGMERGSPKAFSNLLSQTSKSIRFHSWKSKTLVLTKEVWEVYVSGLWYSLCAL